MARRIRNADSDSLRIERVIGHIVEYRLNFTYSSGTLTEGRSVIWEFIAGSRAGLGECGFAGEKAVPGLNVELGGGTWGGFQSAVAPLFFQCRRNQSRVGIGPLGPQVQRGQAPCGQPALKRWRGQAPSGHRARHAVPGFGPPAQ